jgi:plasmid stabilization system protein ParE
VIVVLTGPAIADLREIGSYIAFESPSRAEKVNDGLEQACLRLADSPERYPLVPQLGPNIRRMAYKSYLVFYRVGVTVEVLRVIHGARRYEDLFPEA